jgi:sphingomyelin phosphodiesterase
MNLILAQAKSQHPEIEYIFLTGDYPAHDVWKQDREANLLSAKAVVTSLSDIFPHTKVFPALGNHEIFPVNMFPTEDDPEEPVPKLYDPRWLYNSLANLYQHWLPKESQQETLRDSGYYSVISLYKLACFPLALEHSKVCSLCDFGHLQFILRPLTTAESLIT